MQNSYSNVHSFKQRPVAGFANIFAVCLVMLMLVSVADVLGADMVAPPSGFRVVDAGERSHDGGSALAVTFSKALDEGVDYNQYLSVSRKKEGLVEGGWVLSENRRVVLFPHIEPETTYTISVYQGLPDAGGQPLPQGHSQTLKTRKSQRAVGFASRGAILPGEMAKGLPVATINVAAVDVDFFHILPDKIPQFVARWHAGGQQARWRIADWHGLGKLVHSARFDLDPPPNKRRVVYLPVKEIPAIQKTGLFVAVMRETGSYPDYYATTYFVVSDLGLHIRKYAHQMDVHIASLESAQPLSKVTVSLLDAGGNVLQAGPTTPSGWAHFADPSKKVQVVLARRGRDLGLVAMRDAALDLSDFNVTGRRQNQQEVFLYGPRDLYRPGETVTFAALLRAQDGQTLADIPLQAKITRPDGNTLKQFVWHAQDQGYYQYQLRLPEQTPTGKWLLTVVTPDRTSHRYPFTVADFMPERLRVDFAPADLFIAPTRPLAVEVTAAYLYGAPASGNRVTGAIQVSANRTPLPHLKGFQFGDITEETVNQYFTVKDQTCDAQGRARFEIAPRWEKSRSPLKIQLMASVLESGGRPVTRTFTQTTWPAKALVGIRPLFLDGEGKGHATANSAAAFEIVRADHAANRLGGQGLEVRLVREFRDYFWEFRNGRWRSNYSEKPYVVESRSVDIPKGDRAQVSLPVEWGHYRLEVLDAETGLTASTRFRAGYNWMGAADTNALRRPDKITLRLDKASYGGGDTARVTVIPPQAGQGTLVVAGAAPLWSKTLHVPAQGATVEIPIDADWQRHDIYVTAMVVRAGRESDVKTPKRALGILHLPLDRSPRRIGLELAVPEKIEPNRELAVTVQARFGQSAKTPARTFVTLAAVDVGVLNITDFKTPDAFAWFYGTRRYQPQLRDQYDRVIEQVQGRLARQRFGGGAELSRGGKEPGTKVQIVSLFSGPVALDPEGRARIGLSIPDFNGRLRIMALAFGEDRFGHQQADVTVAAPVVANIATPRFLAAGDHSLIALDLQNMTQETQALKVRLSATAPLVLAPETRTVDLVPGQKSVQIYEVQAAQRFGLSTLHLSVDNQGGAAPPIDIKRRWELGVRPAFPAVTRSKRQIVDTDHPLVLPADLTAEWMPETVEGRLVISDRPPLDLAGHLKNLLDYPYGCLEQTTSRAFPLIFATQDNLTRWKIKRLPESARWERLEYAITKLATLQRPSGGFGLWRQSSPEEYWLTAYVADFLISARESGAAVPDEMIGRVLKRLTHYVRTRTSGYHQRYSQKPAHLSLAYKAYAAYVLSRVQQASLSALRTLFDHHRGEAVSGLPLVHLGLALRNQGDMRRSQLAISQALTLIRPENLYIGDYGSRVRDDALMIATLLSNGHAFSELQPLLLRLSEQLRQRYWMSTQERGALFRAGLALTEQAGKTWQATLQIGDVEQTIASRGTWAIPLDSTLLESSLTIGTAGETPLYAHWEVVGYPLTPPPPQAEKIHLRRQFYDLQGRPLPPAAQTRLEVGQSLLVQVSLEADVAVHDALLVDLLPAGWELEDPNLAHSMKIDDLLVDGKPISKWQAGQQVKYTGYRDDRFVAACDLRADQAVQLFYLVRVVTPGVYQIPPSFAEDMYRPYIRAVGVGEGLLEVTQPHDP